MNHVAGIAGRKLERRIENEFGAPDPYYRLVLKPGAVKPEKVSRGIPPGLKQNDVKVLNAVRKRAYRLDMAFSILGFNLGWTCIVGIVPVVGSFINAWLGIQTIRLAYSVNGGLGNWVLAQMVANVAIDFLLTMVPIFGGSLNALFKCNARNSILLDHYLRQRSFKE